MQDFGSTYAPGTATHELTMYRDPSGALVFGAGTVRWSWGLDGVHDFDSGTPNASTTPDIRMQQATVNLLADMEAQPATLQAGLTAAFATTDSAVPASIIVSPASGASLEQGAPIVISGTATDAGGGVVGGVEVSVDGGATWRRAEGRENWTYAWTTPSAAGPITIRSRAVDDSGNIETPAAGTDVTVNELTCPCTIWSSSVVPGSIETSDTGSIEVGVKFRSDVDGQITGIRFYKGPNNTGTHVGSLWSSSGTLLATAVFANESASGWQQVDFSTPVAIAANTVYVASYFAPNGRYAVDTGYFTVSGVTTGPIYLLQDGEAGGNGVFGYSTSSAFPSESFGASNYWVDVVFDTTPLPPDTTPPEVLSTSPIGGATDVSIHAPVTVTFNEPLDPAKVTTDTVELRDAAAQLVPASVSYDAATRTARLTPSSPLELAAVYTATVRGGEMDPVIRDVAGNALAADLSWSFTVEETASPLVFTVWPDTTVPTIPSASDPDAIELGVKFRANVDGFVTGVRFYKGAANTG
ncbi:MAG: DUF4082 domain-containing protein, partial [Planctomycetes bacterium]|nr:DUF4082 domain-containing protein [Planctomycetota bacterium]